MTGFLVGFMSQFINGFLGNEWAWHAGDRKVRNGSEARCDFLHGMRQCRWRRNASHAHRGGIASTRFLYCQVVQVLF